MIDKNYWTEERILSTVDAGTQKRGKSLAKAKDWKDKGVDDIYLWGECKGSAIYLVKIRMEMGNMKHACSCPVRGAAPCKHVVGLMLYWLGNEGDFSKDAAPSWVQEWRAKHTAQEEKAAAPKDLSPEALAEQEKSKTARRQKRLANMQNGISELELVLQDFVTQGVANSPIMSYSYWDKIAKRMVDAQMPRLASYLFETYKMINATEHWLEILVNRIGELNLLVQTFKTYTSMPEDAPDAEDTLNGMDDLLSTLGVTVMKKDVLSENPAISGLWLTTSVVEDRDIDNRSFRKVWLQELPSKENASNGLLRSALILDFSFNNSGYEMQYDLGMVYAGELTYYSSAVPQRAVLSNLSIRAQEIDLADLQPFSNLNVLLDTYANAIGKNIWLGEYFAILDQVYYKQDVVSQRIYLEDMQGVQLDITGIDSETHYALLAIAGEDTITLIGTLENSRTFHPLTLYTENSFIAIGSLVENYFKHSYEKLFVSSEI